MTFSSSSAGKDRPEYTNAHCYIATAYIVTVCVFDTGKECSMLLD